jgi:transposase
VTLTEGQRDELHRRMRDPKTKSRTRERLEMLRLSDAGMSIPKIAPILRQSEGRVRYWVKRFLESGAFEALEDAPHLGMPSRLTPEHLSALRSEIEKGERTWTTPQISEWLEREQGVSLSGDQIGRKLKQAGIVWKRTSHRLTHKQKPQEVEAKRAELEGLEKRGTRA